VLAHEEEGASHTGARNVWKSNVAQERRSFSKQEERSTSASEDGVRKNRNSQWKYQHQSGSIKEKDLRKKNYGGSK